MRLALLSLLLFISVKALPQAAGDIFLADPTIVYSGGDYYLTGTDDTGAVQGFSLYKSKDLRSWTNVGPILTAGHQCWGTKGFWAPQLVSHDGQWLLLYTANEQVAMAKARDIIGPFVQDNVRPIDASEKNIDPFLFIDDDSKAYLYHVRFNHGNYIWCGEFDMAKGELVTGTLRRCFAATQDWERTNDYPSDPILEGPTVVKLHGKYYLFYSANHFMSKDYAVGYAVADSPLGPWVKYPGNPILHRSILGETGDGHGDIFKDKRGHLFYVYHVHYSDSKATPRRTRIVALTAKKGKDRYYTIKADKKKVIIPRVSQ